MFQEQKLPDIGETFIGIITSGYVFAGNFVVKTVAVAEAEVVAWR